MSVPFISRVYGKKNPNPSPAEPHKLPPLREEEAARERAKLANDAIKLEFQRRKLDGEGVRW